MLPGGSLSIFARFISDRARILTSVNSSKTTICVLVYVLTRQGAIAANAQKGIALELMEEHVKVKDSK
jgi:hypothetical protein